ncbi:[acyl-carrier-protein] phosphodiesterase protein [Rhizobium etli CFN 42]|uniref:FMN-dependent NADH:quinone oxidoreductase 1 n=2 Tax=Rhizobium etli TaxID=29449 RepID=AZOR1_RHIEC|nr:FMN-dependent NADH-azoreductase [Rhizobium etli]Q2K9C7.1 RecName: Full=FMN-dependent NADH:quinone oxidoreductase 1; AltName: Full=Azo-dye reductase 1; AltName: Full=FMN-dependent NADH-azo compound oxidoreductase 1; AltName: Full=FMN-dependent NADH-azoreductase 1 [Rhizobium etli CFN 42]ABC90559.1 [acyl-carrier-protein] phosphodiesterase protein [Rhizobium etli CFN 42]AGS21612.1 FMN-dependent NADH-azoreductase 1 [Rhizobium etli bv. mimosae str. Mim1]ARQ09885.1 FMN-dependent NADH-azoreductase 1
MSSILLLTSSPRAESLSTPIAADLAEKLKNQKPGSVVVRRDLAATPLPHIDDLFTGAIRKPAEARTAEEIAAVKTSDELVAELFAADTIVISTGLINFNIYSSLKTWIDNVARAGVTFKYTESGPVGLVTGKKVYVVLASGGVYSQGPAAPLNHAVPYLKSVLGFLGITDIETIYVEGLAFGPEAAEKAIGAAKSRVEEIALAA